MMSNFKIVHEIDGRLRVRFGQYAFTSGQATILKSDFLRWENYWNWVCDNEEKYPNLVSFLNRLQQNDKGILKNVFDNVQA